MVVAVEIVNFSEPKLFLGGWRNVARDVEYHDAVSQTPYYTTMEYDIPKPPQEDAPPIQRVSVLIQTSARCVKSVSTTGMTNRAVQANMYYHIPDLNDRFVSVKAARLTVRRRDAAVKIQRWYRLHCAQKRFDNQDVDQDEDETEYEQEEEEDDVSEYKSIPEIPCISAKSDGTNLCMINPVDARTRDDADLRLLRTLLERWAEAEEERIRVAVPAARIATERAEKLRKEIEFLRAIESSRSEAAKRKAEHSRAKFLNELAKPVDIHVTLKEEKRSIVHIETLGVQQAQEFRNFYDNLTQDHSEEDDEQQRRIELLYALKRMAMHHTCSASLSLENLIDQELFLLSSGVDATKLRPLRSRIRLGFLRLARGVLMRGNDRIKCTSRTKLCQSCGRLKRIEAFEVDHRQTISKTCADCASLRHKRCEQQASAQVFEAMLRELRRNEASRPKGSCSLAFIVGPKTIGYLVYDIWHGRSAISECDDLGRLRLVRLNPNEPWTPWNTLLATRREARMHEALSRESVPEAYGAELLRKFRRLNLQARLYFQRMAKSEDSGLSL